MWTLASRDVAVTQPRDSLNSTTSTEARALRVGVGPGDLPSFGIAARQQASAAAVAEKEQATAAAAAAAAAAIPAAERQQSPILMAPSAAAAQTACAHHQDAANHKEGTKQNPHSNQSSESHQQRRLDQGSLGKSGSCDCCLASDEAMLAKGSLDSASSDSADMLSKRAKRSR